MFNYSEPVISSPNFSELNLQSKILVIEGNTSIRAKHCSYILAEKRKQYQVLQTDNGEDGINLWRSQSPDVIIVDIDLPDNFGLLFLEIAQKELNIPRLPIIVLANAEDEKLIEKTIELGVFDYLTKNVSAVSLRQSIYNLIEEINLLCNLQYSESKYHTIFDNFPVGLASLSLTGHFLAVNQDICNILGYHADDLLRMNAIEITHPDYIDVTIKCLDQLLSGEVSNLVLEKQYLHKNGKVVEAISRLGLVNDISGNPIQFVVSVENITERRVNEAKLASAKLAEAANKAKSDFLAAMSHEIRNPMNAVIGMTEILSNTVLSNQQKQIVATIRQGGEVLLSVINKILDLSQIESGKVEIEAQAFDLYLCIEEILDLMSSQTVEKKLELSLLIDLSVPQQIIGDSTCLRQVLVNLIGNAVKFTEQGNVDITVSSKIIDSEKNLSQLTFQVKDTGLGIEPEAMSRLFKPFSQADSSIARQYGGTGLGLAISKHLCNLMGGDIEVVSEVGKGSTFSFTILAKTISISPSEINPEFKPELVGKRVLVIKNNSIVQQMMQNYGQLWGMQVKSAYTELEALQYLEVQDFDIVLIDYNLKSMQGKDLARNIQEIFPNLLIVLLISVADSAIAYTQNFAGYLTKPITPSKLFKLFTNLSNITSGQNLVVTENLETPQIDSNFALSYPLKILIVEDNTVNQQIIYLMLEKLGYQADSVSNGLDAVVAVTRQPYELIFMDIQMPLMDGITACRQIRQLSDRNPWIIGLSASAFRESREKALAAGMNEYLTKPLKIEDLLKNIKKLSQEDRFNHHPYTKESGAFRLNNISNIELAKDILNPQISSQSSNNLSANSVDYSLEPELYLSGLEVINMSTLSSLEKCIGESNLSVIIKSYLHDSKRAINQMLISLHQLDIIKIRFENHTLKGGCGTFGADRLAALCQKIQYFCKSENCENRIHILEAIIKQLEIEYDKLFNFFQERY